LVSIEAGQSGTAEEIFNTNCFRSVFAPLVVASLAIGCAQSSGTPTSPSSAGGSLVLTTEQLSGTWNLLSMQPAGHPDQASPPGASYTLILADGRLSTRADCNTCSGKFALSEQILTAGPLLACTVAACPTMAFENTYKNLLSGDSTVLLSGDTLVLSSARGVLRFSR
jgi:heat shock protein HslJ